MGLFVPCNGNKIYIYKYISKISRDKLVPVEFNQVTDAANTIQPTSIISVWACFVQNAWGGVVTLTATKQFGFLSSDGVNSSLQAVENQ